MSIISSLFSLVVALFLLFGNKAHAQESKKLVPIHIVVVADHSGSMYTPTGFSAVQTEAIVNTLSNYLESCDNTLITYLPWGSKPGEGFTAHLNVPTERYRFIDQVKALAQTQLGTTEHDLAYWRAKDILAGAEHGVMIFLTDESGTKSVEDTPNFALYKISLGEVTNYLSKSFVVGYGTVYSATNTSALSEIVGAILADSKRDLCLG